MTLRKHVGAKRGCHEEAKTDIQTTSEELPQDESHDEFHTDRGLERARRETRERESEGGEIAIHPIHPCRDIDVEA